MVLDTVTVFINNDTSIYVVGKFSVSNDNDSVSWHARLGHIGQYHLKRLARVGLWDHLPKLNYLFVSIALLEKQLDYHLAKLKEPLVNYNLFIRISVAQWM